MGKGRRGAVCPTSGCTYALSMTHSITQSVTLRKGQTKPDTRNKPIDTRIFFKLCKPTTMKSAVCSAILLLASSSIVSGFVIQHGASALLTKTRGNPNALPMARDDFEFSFEIPKKGIADVGTAEVKLPPVLEKSDLVVVRYDLPFGLDASPDKKSGQVVVTKDGKEGGEKVGDILRQTTYWRGREPGIFDVSKNADNFDLVVQALVTNDLSVADEIVLVFERPL
jgi:hypothetical protein